MEKPIVELANTAEKVVVKLPKVNTYTMIGAAAGVALGVGTTIAVKKFRVWRAEKKLVVE